MAGIEVLRQDETLIIDDIHLPRRRAYEMNRANPDDMRRLFAPLFSQNERRRRDPLPTLADEETLIIDGILPRRRAYAINRANPDEVSRLFAIRSRELERRRRDAIINALNLRRGGQQIHAAVDDARRLNGDEEQRRNFLSSEIWRLLSTEKYECGGGFCVVCQSEFEEGDKLGKLGCGHSYHAPCIHTWLLKKNQCPLCKQTAIPELQST